LRSIKEGEILRITLNEDKPHIKPLPSGDRKLTQAEIDELVKKLLAAKSAGQGPKPA